MKNNKIKQVEEFIRVVAKVPNDAKLYSYEFKSNGSVETVSYFYDEIIYTKIPMVDEQYKNSKYEAYPLLRGICNIIGVDYNHIVSLAYLDGSLMVNIMEH